MRLPHALLVAALVGLVLASSPLSVENAAFGAYNEEWDGLGHLFSVERDGVVPRLTWNGHAVRLLHGSLGPLDPQRDALLIVGPQRAYSAAEADDLRAFLRAGGRAILADDVGTGRGLLEELRVGPLLSGRSVFTPAYAKDPRFPVGLSTGALPGLPPEAVLNRPVAVLGNGTPVLVSHPLSWHDENGNARADLGEARGRFVFARMAFPGEGVLLVLGDPSILIGEMAAVDAEVVHVLLAWLVEGHRTLVVDESRRASGDPLHVAPFLGGDFPASAAVAVLVAVTVGVAGAAAKLRFRRERPAAPLPVRRPPLTPLETRVVDELER